jgi:hypothetical protein
MEARMTRRWLVSVFAVSSLVVACGEEVLIVEGDGGSGGSGAAGSGKGGSFGTGGAGGDGGGGGSSVGGASSGGFGTGGAGGDAGGGGSGVGGAASGGFGAAGGCGGAGGCFGGAGTAGAGGSVIDGGESDATVPGAPVIGGNGYLSIEAGPYVLVGYVSSFVGGSSSSISLTYDSTSFCASGTVGMNSTYQSYAGAGFDVDQAQSPTGGSVSSLLLTGSSMTLSFENPADSPLEIQLSNSTGTYWCYELAGATSPVTIPLTSFNTECWDDEGQAFVSGTAITSIDLVVPGSATSSTPYSFCFLGLTIQ